MEINKSNLSIIILAGNEEKTIIDCLKSCSWAKEIILVAANSTDNTITLARKTISTIKIIKTNDEYNKNFSKWRNLGFKQTTNKWILYIDSDERITQSLKQEIIKIISTKSIEYSHFAIPRANFYLGKRVKYGGSYPDYVIRLFQKKEFKGYQGILHEQPIVVGKLAYLKSDLLHFTHRDLSSMLQKSLVWTDMEAYALYQSHHPPIVWWRIIRMMFTKIWERLIKQQMWRDKTVGWISVIFETFNSFMIYARLWEIQQKNKK
ncbi:MAG: glycosyltransferase family 2 protein [Candidatus Shapirobacteria bacterium]|nr:glycosyltransferase family 2 protein [Candidatus Shapirobacteria bacterium]